MHEEQTVPMVIDRTVAVTATITALAMLLAGWTESNLVWGVNHLRFLSPSTRISLGLVLVSAVAASLLLPRATCERIVGGGSSLIAHCTGWRYVLLAVGTAAFFYIMRLPNSFLGDGYTLLGNFSTANEYVHKWTEPASSALVRGLQAALGGFSHQTALLSFQYLSVLSGAAVVVTVVALVRRLVVHPANQCVAAVALLFSGGTLLYFGYVEFYPLLWAALILYVYWAVRALRGGRLIELLAALFFYLIAVAIHLQALWLVGTALWLAAARLLPGLSGRRLRMILVVAAALGAIAVSAGYFWLLERDDSLALIFLPLLTGRSSSPEYAALSPKHLLDIVNLVFLLFPGLAAIAVGRAVCRARASATKLSVFFAPGTFGGAAFLALVDPVLGMARDWDLLSFTVVPPMLWLLVSFDRHGMHLSGRVVLLLAVVAVSNGTLYAAVYSSSQAAEDRQLALLRYYGGKDYAGWKIFRDYLAQEGQATEAKAVSEEIMRVLPRHRRLAEGWACLFRNDLQTAAAIAGNLVLEDPDHAEFLQLQGDVAAGRGDTALARRALHRALRIKPDFPPVLRSLAQLSMREGDFTSAVDMLRRARRLAPQSVEILDDLGAMYIALGHTDSATAVADTILAGQGSAAGGHLIKLIAASKAGDTLTARRHYDLYRQHGRGRPEYDRMLRSYSFLLAPRTAP